LRSFELQEIEPFKSFVFVTFFMKTLSAQLLLLQSNILQIQKCFQL